MRYKILRWNKTKYFVKNNGSDNIDRGNYVYKYIKLKLYKYMTQ